MHVDHQPSKPTMPAPRLAIGENVARTMSSREIADLTNSGHDNVLKTIRALMARGVVSGNETPYVHPQNGQTYSEFLLSYRDTMVVVSGYSVELRARIIDRWQKLEAQAAKPVELSRMDILQIAMESEKARLLAVEQLAIAAPKVAFVDQYVEAAGTFSFRQVAKTIGANERQFRQMLLDTSTMYYLGGVLTPSAQHIASGRFEVKTGTSEHNGHAFTQARFTAKGVEWIAGKWKQYSEVAA